jgi:hypothetical protein
MFSRSTTSWYLRHKIGYGNVTLDAMIEDAATETGC